MDETGSPVNQTMYRGIIGSLLYLTTSRTDIVFSVGLCARFESNPKECHLKAAKWILRYLKGTQDLVLYYLSSDNFNVIGYADADYAGYLMDRKSTSGMTHFLGSCLISWGIRK
ncbi:secreted RxLR effector protein 161-like [Nicotiana sylvestris]|uniref:secreted RxLR effector protein 161-like n=1 Tax=Nicotiana sylvestris TaxID=4096 RepID=UPI00388C4AB2